MAEFDSSQIPNRLIASIPIYFGAHGAILFAGDSVDLSLGGLYLKTELPLNLGERIYLNINLPTLDDAVSCEGKVAWVNPSLASSKPHFPSGVGVEFVHLTSNVEEEIKRFINWRTPREST